MSISRKYGRTYHYPFSPGTTSDDRIAHSYWAAMQRAPLWIHTEKLDGENNCLSRLGVFARSHAAPTTSPWAAALRQRWHSLKEDLGELELFGENLYAIHSIEYRALEDHFYLFAVRYRDVWLSWEEVKFYAAAFDFPTVPELQTFAPPAGEAHLRRGVLHLAGQQSSLASADATTGEWCTREGVVTRAAGEFGVDMHPDCVFKYVRKGHVKTDEHWSRAWRRAPLVWEKPTDHPQNSKGHVDA